MNLNILFLITSSSINSLKFFSVGDKAISLLMQYISNSDWHSYYLNRFYIPKLYPSSNIEMPSVMYKQLLRGNNRKKYNIIIKTIMLICE